MYSKRHLTLYREAMCLFGFQVIPAKQMAQMK
jgi:hypothetical protein